PWYSLNLDDPAACEAAAIPVERIAGPVLLLSGEDDAMWPSIRMGEMVMARLRAHGHPYPDRHLRYRGAGHLLSFPYLPPSVHPSRHPALGAAFAYGGNPRDQVRANADSWHTVLEFLEGGKV
ncbi:MAG: acyl-CoA thioester hydrolase/BAAT C-terminal domain-containing protein, partial [Ktedonobacterales bacterium]